MNLSFSRQYRLITQKDFQFVFDKPYKINCPGLQVLYRQNNREHARLGLIIAKHRVKRAVDRNYLRRVIRESFRHHQDQLKGLDIIVMVRANPFVSDLAILQKSVDNLWAKLIT